VEYRNPACGLSTAGNWALNQGARVLQRGYRALVGGWWRAIEGTVGAAPHYAGPTFLGTRSRRFLTSYDYNRDPGGPAAVTRDGYLKRRNPLARREPPTSSSLIAPARRIAGIVIKSLFVIGPRSGWPEFVAD